MKKQPIKSIYFIKAICALGIIVFHFGREVTGINTALLTSYVNGDWGETLVTVFFAVSGALLYYHYSDGNMNLSQYLWRRWKGIYPMFYLAYFCFMLIRVYELGSLFYYDAPWAYGVTLLGMDGYLINSVGVYYIVGEWFLGAIVIMYLLYPVILPFWKKNHMATFGLILAVYLLFYNKPITNAVGFCTVSSCLMSFAFGMLFMEHREFFTSKAGTAAALLGCLVLYFVKLPISANGADHLFGGCLLIVLTAIGEHLMGYGPVEKLFRILGALSYPVFLVHHEMLYLLLDHWQPDTVWEVVAFLMAGICVILLAAKLLAMATDIMMKIFHRFFGKILAKNRVMS